MEKGINLGKDDQNYPETYYYFLNLKGSPQLAIILMVQEYNKTFQMSVPITWNVTDIIPILTKTQSKYFPT